MLEKILKNKIWDSYYIIKDEFDEIKKGYDFGKYLSDDVKERYKLIRNGSKDPLLATQITAQLLEYELAWSEVKKQEAISNSSLGICIYFITHRKEDKLFSDLCQKVKRVC